MAATRLTDSQKSELVERYRQGETSAELALAYGCSPNTVSRTVKAALEPAEYEQLKQQQRGRGAALPQLAPQPAEATGGVSPATEATANAEHSVADTSLAEVGAHQATAAVVAEPVAPALEDVSAVLAIDDADDFAGDDSDTDDEDGGEELSSDDDIFTPIAVLPLVLHQEPVAVQPLAAAELPDSLYMLVDKTVELQARPLREFTELGQLPADEEELQALQLFANPRQAKRHCGRTQRVIKMPDPAVLVRRASYLQVKGITRLVVEGNLYALPGC